jgi:1,4-dihydroxy-2-naphthoate octaprenyltransferase
MNRWLIGARPRTLPAAVVPVVVGAACAVDLPRDQGWWTGEGVVASTDSLGPVWWRVALALLVSLALQIGVNYANDYSDGVRGTDDVRVGPARLVANGLAPASSVKRAAFLAFGVAAVAGFVIALATSPWLVVVGAVAIAAGWFYTGGSRPYGYSGWGEVFVFVFFGLVATVGTTYAATETITPLSIDMGAAIGALACALLVINNLRDIPTDRQVGKRTLAVRLGDRRTRQLYVALIALAYVLVAVAAFARPWVLLAVISLPLAVPPCRRVLTGSVGGDLIPVLGDTGRLQLVFGVLATVGLAIN